MTMLCLYSIKGAFFRFTARVAFVMCRALRTLTAKMYSFFLCVTTMQKFLLSVVTVFLPLFGSLFTGAQ